MGSPSRLLVGCALLAQATPRWGRDVPSGTPTPPKARLCIQDSRNIYVRYLWDRTLADRVCFWGIRIQVQEMRGTTIQQEVFSE